MIGALAEARVKKQRGTPMSFPRCVKRRGRSRSTLIPHIGLSLHNKADSATACSALPSFAAEKLPVIPQAPCVGYFACFHVHVIDNREVAGVKLQQDVNT